MQGGGNSTKRTTILRHFRKQDDELPLFLGNHNKNGDLHTGRQVAGRFDKPFASVGLSVLQLCHCYVPAFVLSCACVSPRRVICVDRRVAVSS